jgi:hypothetical protein
MVRNCACVRTHLFQNYFFVLIDNVVLYAVNGKTNST